MRSSLALSLSRVRLCPSSRGEGGRRPDEGAEPAFDFAFSPAQDPLTPALSPRRGSVCASSLNMTFCETAHQFVTQLSPPKVLPTSLGKSTLVATINSDNVTGRFIPLVSLESWDRHVFSSSIDSLVWHRRQFLPALLCSAHSTNQTLGGNDAVPGR